MRETSSLNNAKCFAAIQAFHQKAVDINEYWATKVWSTGGAESTKNKEEQTNLEESLWVLAGTGKGMKNLYPERFDDNGNLLTKCANAGAEIWGSDCE